ncbi:MAG: Prolyl-tRNA synthetase [Candidatus Alkanophagales archaeon MCA70_species_1]|nr:Prolyl-tRNA synthetase [Candidatus Alkanophaga volatiphilum]
MADEEREAKTVIPKENFSEWYNEVLRRAEIMDVRYPVKGLYVWFPFGLKLRNLIYSILRALLDEEHDEVLFPTLIPRTEFMKEEKHIKGFEDEVFWVTKGGVDELDVPLALRPTSETAIYPMFKVWIRSHADLPLRVYQIVNVFRYETKHTRPLIRLREVTSFKEAHTAHRSWEEAEAQVRKAINIYRAFYDRLAVPYIITKRPDWDKFPGAAYTIAFDTIMPDGRTLQIATIHHLGTNFAKTFDIKYEDIGGEYKYVHQTCYGISERCVAAVIATHGDDHGLVLPPEVAPTQIVIVPIIFSKDERSAAVIETCRSVHAALKNSFRVVLDEGEERPGAKFYKWEMRGVPLRIEIGPRDVSREECTFVRRDTFERFTVPLSNVVSEAEKVLKDVYENIWRRSKEHFASRIFDFCGNERGQGREDEIKECVRRGVVAIFMCGSEECGVEVKERFDADVLGEEVTTCLGDAGERRGCCIICGAEGKRTYIARTY